MDLAPGAASSRTLAILPAPKPTTLPSPCTYQPEDFTVVDRVVELAGKKGVSAAQIATASISNKPGVTAPIIGASRMHQLEEAVAALEIELSPDEMQFLEEPYRPHGVLGHS